MEELADNSDRQIISLGVRFVSSRYNRVDQGNTHYLLPGVGGGRFFSVGRDHMVFRENWKEISCRQQKFKANLLYREIIRIL